MSGGVLNEFGTRNMCVFVEGEPNSSLPGEMVTIGGTLV